MKKILMLVATLGSVYVSHASQASTLGSNGVNNGNTGSWLSQWSEWSQDPRVQEAKKSLFGSATDTGAVRSLEQQRADAQMAASNQGQQNEQNGSIMATLSSWLSPEGSVARQDAITRQQDVNRQQDANRQVVGSYWQRQQSPQQLQNQQPAENRSMFDQRQIEQGLGLWKTLQDWWNGSSVNAANPSYTPAGAPIR